MLCHTSWKEAWNVATAYKAPSLWLRARKFCNTSWKEAWNVAATYKAHFLCKSKEAEKKVCFAI